MNYEGKILDFLDGSLSDSESAELLHGLSVSPEKRVILEQHIQLKGMITSAQKPLKVPAELERTMNRRIPVIASYNGELALGTAAMVGGSSISRISAFFSKKPVRLAAVGLLLLLSSSYLAFSTNEIDQHPSMSLKDVGSSTTATYNSPTTTFSSSTASGITDMVRNSEKSSTVSRVNNKPIDRSINSIIQRAATKQMNGSALDDQRNASAVKTESSNTIGTKLDVSYPIETALISSISTPRVEEEMNITLNSIGEPRYISPFGKKYDRLQVPVLLRFEYGMGQAYFRVNTSGVVQNTRIESAPLFGIDYIASPYFSLGLEGGSAGIARVVPSELYEKAHNITRLVTSNTIEASNHFYTRLMARYTINPYDIFHIETGVGFGAAFGETAEPLIAATTALSYDLNEKLSMSGGVSFAGTFSKIANPERTGDIPTKTGAMPVGYILENTPASSTLFSPSLTFRFGLRFKPW